MKPTTHERVDWSLARVVFIVAPTCPRCGGLGYDRVRTEANGDGSTTRKVRCRGCGEPYKISVELPDSGNEAV